MAPAFPRGFPPSPDRHTKAPPQSLAFHQALFWSPVGLRDRLLCYILYRGKKQERAVDARPSGYSFRCSGKQPEQQATAGTASPRKSRSSDRLDCARKKSGGILPSGELPRCRASVHGEPLSFGTIADEAAQRL